MLADLDTLVIALYCAACSLFPASDLGPRRGRPLKISDNELICLMVAQMLLGYPSERQFLPVARWRLGHLFPNLPAQSTSNTRCRALSAKLVTLWRAISAELPGFTDQLSFIDTTPLPCGQSVQTVNRSELAPWCAFGYPAAHSRFYWGMRLVLWCGPDGCVRDFDLVPANAPERDAALELLQRQPINGQLVIADKEPLRRRRLRTRHLGRPRSHPAAPQPTRRAQPANPTDRAHPSAHRIDRAKPQRPTPARTPPRPHTRRPARTHHRPHPSPPQHRHPPQLATRPTHTSPHRLRPSTDQTSRAMGVDLTWKHEAIRNHAERLAGGPGDIPQRVALLHGIFLDSGGNHAFPEVALHGALWAYGFYERRGVVSRSIAYRYFYDADERARRAYMLFRFSQGFKEANRSVFVDTYANYVFAKRHGEAPGADEILAPALLEALNRVHEARRAGRQLRERERAEVFETALLLRAGADCRPENPRGSSTVRLSYPCGDCVTPGCSIRVLPTRDLPGVPQLR